MDIAARLIQSAEQGAALIFSGSKCKETLAMDLLCADDADLRDRMRNGKLSDQDWARLARLAYRLSQIRLYIDDTPPGELEVKEAQEKIVKLSCELGAKYPLRVFFVGHGEGELKKKFQKKRYEGWIEYQ